MKEKISKIAPGASIIILGLGLLVFGLSSGQNGTFLIASASIAFAGVLTLLNGMGIITNKMATGVAAVLILLSGYLAYGNYNSIDTPIQFMKEKQRRYAGVIQSLKDLRQVEIAYKKQNKKFCGNMDTLIDFLSHDSVIIVKMTGVVPDTLSEAEALELGIITRDTTLHPASVIAFNDKYMETRDAKFKLNISTLRYVPFTENVEFEIEAGEITRLSGAKVQVFEIKDAKPFDKKDVMLVGSMIDPTTAGNWKEEK